MKSLAEKGAEVIGVSGDTVKSQALFKKANKLNYTLLADNDGAVAKKFGVPLRKGGAFEREIDGVKVKIARGVTPGRWTFVIGKDGKIAHKNPKANAGKDSKQILELLKK